MLEEDPMLEDELSQVHASIEEVRDEPEYAEMTPKICEKNDLLALDSNQKMDLDKLTCHDSQTFTGLVESPPGSIMGSSDETPINHLHKTLPTVLRYRKAQAAVRRLKPLSETQEPSGSASQPAAHIHLEKALAPAQAEPSPAPARHRPIMSPVH